VTERRGWIAGQCWHLPQEHEIELFGKRRMEEGERARRVAQPRERRVLLLGGAVRVPDEGGN
jgi:hypothetical protein